MSGLAAKADAAGRAPESGEAVRPAAARAASCWGSPKCWLGRKGSWAPGDAHRGSQSWTRRSPSSETVGRWWGGGTGDANEKENDKWGGSSGMDF